MTKSVININYHKKTCGKCKHRKQQGCFFFWRNNTFNHSDTCRIFEKVLNIKGENSKGDIVFYRLKECIQAEKDYLELLLKKG